MTMTTSRIAQAFREGREAVVEVKWWLKLKNKGLHAQEPAAELIRWYGRRKLKKLLRKIGSED